MNVQNLRIEEERPEVMYPIEQAVVDAYADHPDLTDREVGGAFGSLITHHRAQQRGLEPQHHLTGGVQTLFDGLLPVTASLLATGTADVPLLVRGLTRLRKSVSFCAKKGGRQGYLNYIRGMLR